MRRLNGSSEAANSVAIVPFLAKDNFLIVRKFGGESESVNERTEYWVTGYVDI